jgi:hypothetical protein
MQRNRSVVVLIALLLLVMVSCSPKKRSQWQGPSYSEKVGEVPDDVCIVDGKPVILGASTESEGGFVLIYLRENGDIVAHQWLNDPIAGLALQDSGEFYWIGGTCPSSQ